MGNLARSGPLKIMMLGFLYLIKLDSDGSGKLAFLVDKNLLKYLYSVYRTDTNTFNLANNKYMISIEDVICLTGLNASGEQIYLNDTSGWRKLCKDHLGLVPEESNMKRQGVKLDWLKTHFEKIEDPTKEGLKRSVRAYLLYVIGNIIFLDSTGCVSTKYLPHLQDLDNVHKYS